MFFSNCSRVTVDRDSLADVLGGRRLTDRVMDWVNHIITQRYGYVTLNPSLQLLPDQIQQVRSTDKAIIILYAGEEQYDGHWRTAVYSNGRVTVYDSMMEGILSGREKYVLRKLFGQQVTHTFSTVASRQRNTVDCGVFAIAYAVDVALGADASSSVYEQGAMRPFLHHLLVSDVGLLRFPLALTVSVRTTTVPAIPQEQVQVPSTNEPSDSTLQQMLPQLFLLIQSSTEYACNSINPQFATRVRVRPFLHLTKVTSRKAGGFFYSLARWHPGYKHVLLYDFFGRSKVRDITLPEKNIPSTYLPPSVGVTNVKVVCVQTLPVPNLEQASLTRCVAFMLAFASSKEPTIAQYDWNAVLTHVASVLRDGVVSECPKASTLPYVPLRQDVEQPTALTIKKSKTGRRSLFPALASVSLYTLGDLRLKCVHCNALHFEAEKKSGTMMHLCCRAGQIRPQPLHPVPPYLQSLLTGDEEHCVSFRRNIRAYNGALAFASLKVSSDNLVPGGCYTVQGQIYSVVSDGAPVEAAAATANQLWFVETEESVGIRLDRYDAVRRDILAGLIDEMHNYNPFSKAYRTMRSAMARARVGAPTLNLVLSENMASVMRANPGLVHRPTGTEVAAIFTSENPVRDARMVVTSVANDQTSFVATLNPLGDPLLFPLLFPCGELGFAPSNDFRVPLSSERINASVAEYYLYRLAHREHQFTMLFGGRLLQQYVVHAYLKVEDCRLKWVSDNQKKLRADTYSGLHDFLSNAAARVQGRVGKLVILPATFRGSPRQRYQKYMDCLAGIREFGRYDLFVTFTCNPGWSEIKNNLAPGQHHSDRVDLACRVFKLKLDYLLDFVITQRPFGDVLYWTYVIEFQKRGLPHAHIVFTLSEQHRVNTPMAIDRVISAEIPPQGHPLRAQVLATMVHKPCEDNPSAVCRTRGTCRFKYPQDFRQHTAILGKRPVYRRSEGDSAVVQGKTITNRNIVPYNPILLKVMGSHINVEAYQEGMGIKYLYKYLYKGVKYEHVTFGLEEDGRLSVVELDEVKEYRTGRYLSSYEAYWNLASFPMFGSSHAVMRLQVHMPDGQSLLFAAGGEEAADRRASVKSTQLTAFFDLNRKDPSAQELTYLKLPLHYTWKPDQGEWTRRKRADKMIVRIHDVPPRYGDLFFLRLLLHRVPGPRSFQELRTCDGVVHNTFKEACVSRGYIVNDDYYRSCLADAATLSVPSALRLLFVHLVYHCVPVDTQGLYSEFEEHLLHDWTMRCHSSSEAADVVHTLLRKYFRNLGSTPEHFGLQLGGFEDPSECPQLAQLMPQEEQFEVVQSDQDISHTTLNQGQRAFYDAVLAAMDQHGGAFFLDGPAGTGKTHVMNCLVARASLAGEVVVTAWSGIAATLLPGGMTMHTVFRLPLKMDEYATVGLTLQSDRAAQLKRAKLLIFDEVSMIHGHALRAVDDFLRELMEKPRSTFGGKTVVLSGDFRQLLPVVTGGERSQTIVASAFPFWRAVRRYRLTQNVRMNDDSTYATFVLDVGNGTVTSVEFPPQCMVQSLDKLIDEVLFCHDSERTAALLLAAINEDVDRINRIASSRVEGEETTYYSQDSHNVEGEVGLPVEVLNSMTPSGMPSHILSLKVGQPVILLTNLDVRAGLCNGTRMTVVRPERHVVLCRVSVGANAGKEVFVGRVGFRSKEEQMNFDRLQIPLRLAYAITVHKAQGQTIGKVGLYLSRPPFAHGMLYVALSRVRSSRDIRVFVASAATQSDTNKVKNVVCKEVLT